MPSLTQPKLDWDGFVKKLKSQNFGENDSKIVSTINHPVDAVDRALQWLKAQQEAINNPYSTIDQQVEAGLNLAGVMQTGAVPFAPKSEGGTLGTFIGPKAATWNKEAAEKAAALLDAGVDPAKVWKEHLIGRMPDGNLFSEIDDSLATITPLEHPYLAKRINADVSIGESMKDKAPMSLDDLISHPELERNYFQTREKSPEIWFDDLRQNRRGNFTTDSYGGDVIQLSNKLAVDENQEKSTLLHELQHSIQNKEGWSKGGSAEGGWMGDRQTVMGIYKELMDNANKPMSIEEYAKVAWGEPATKKEVIDDYHKAYLPSLKANVHQLDKEFQNQAGREYYRRLAGEAQARATQDRMNMSMDERRNNYPLKGGLLSDIPLDQLIYRYGGQQ